MNNSNRKMILSYNESLEEMPYIIRNDQLYITYQPDAVQNVKTLQTLNIRSNGDYRKHMTHHAQNIMDSNRMAALNYNQYPHSFSK